MAYTKRITIKKTLNKSLSYIENSNKTESGILVYGLNCSINSKVAYKQMNHTKKYYCQENGNVGYHFIQSFKPGEIDINKAHEIAIKWAGKITEGKYQALITTHNDKDHIHNHIVMNSVSFVDGKKYNSCKDELKHIRELSDDICKEYNKSIISPKSKGKSYKEWSEDKKGTSWKSTIKSEIDKVIPTVKDFEELVQVLEKKGYEVNYKNLKHITFRAPGQLRKTRGKTIGDEYTEEALRRRIEQSKNELHIVKYKSKDKKEWIDFDVYRYKFKRGSIGNNIALTALILKNLLGINTNSKSKKISGYKKINRQYATKSLRELEKALLFFECNNNNIETKNDIEKNINKFDIKNYKINKNISDLNIKINNIDNLVKLINKLDKDSNKYAEYKSSFFKTIKYRKQIEEFENSKKILQENNIKSQKDKEIIVTYKNKYIAQIQKYNEQIIKNKTEKKENLDILNIIKNVEEKKYIKELNHQEMKDSSEVINNSKIQKEDSFKDEKNCKYDLEK